MQKGRALIAACKPPLTAALFGAFLFTNDPAISDPREPTATDTGTSAPAGCDPQNVVVYQADQVAAEQRCVLIRGPRSRPSTGIIRSRPRRPAQPWCVRARRSRSGACIPSSFAGWRPPSGRRGRPALLPPASSRPIGRPRSGRRLLRQVRFAAHLWARGRHAGIGGPGSSGRGSGTDRCPAWRGLSLRGAEPSRVESLPAYAGAHRAAGKSAARDRRGERADRSRQHVRGRQFADREPGKRGRGHQRGCSCAGAPVLPGPALAALAQALAERRLGAQALAGDADDDAGQRPLHQRSDRTRTGRAGLRAAAASDAGSCSRAARTPAASAASRLRRGRKRCIAGRSRQAPRGTRPEMPRRAPFSPHGEGRGPVPRVSRHSS